MKKILLGTSALAVAALVGGPAAAAEAPEMSISGALEYHVRSVDSDPARSSAFEVASQQYWSEIVFRGEGKTDAGMSYAAEIQFRPISMGLDEAFLTFGDSWGTLVLGDEDGPLSGGEIFGFNVLPIGGIDALPYGINPDVAGLVAESQDSSKIMYKTPSMSGVSAALSFTPQVGSGFGAGTTVTDDDTLTEATYVDVMEVGVNYSGNFGNVSVGAHAGGVLSGDVGGDNGDAFEGPDGMQAGVKVAMSGFTFAVGYADRGSAGLADGTTDDNGNFVDVGVAYSMDAMDVGLGYYMGSDIGGDTDITGTYLEMGYTIAEGLWAFAGIGMVDEEVGATSSDETSIVIGSRITF